MHVHRNTRKVLIGKHPLKKYKVRGPNLGHFCLLTNGTSLGKFHNRPVRILQASYFLHSKFEVQSPQDTQEQSDFVHVIHIANCFGGWYLIWDTSIN